MRVVQPLNSQVNWRISRTGVFTVASMISLALVAWLVILPLMGLMTTMNTDSGVPRFSLPILSMGMMFLSPDVSNVSFFLFLWVFGMIAMMFPAMIPVVSMYNFSIAKRSARASLGRVAGTTLFLGGYLLLYAVLGVGVYAVAFVAFNLSGLIPALASYTLPVASGLLIATGVWQLTPLKDRCLSKCVSPFGFFLLHMRKGLFGAFRMGMEHGYYCVGCCWLFMLVMLGVGAMSVLSMLLLASLIMVEKAIVQGAVWFRWFSALLFIGLGSALILLPSLMGP